MEQYLDQKDGKWHITLWTELPRVIVKNKLNFRIKSVTLNDGSVVSDPQINNSKHKFSINDSMLGKRVFFNFSFDIEEISNISNIKIGLCDEKIVWFSNTIIDIVNLYLCKININKNIIKENIIENNSTLSNTSNSDIIDISINENKKELLDNSVNIFLKSNNITSNVIKKQRKIKK